MRSIVIVEADVLALEGPEFEDESETAFAANLGVSVPSPHPVTVTVNVVPVLAFGLKEQPEAVPAFEKSVPLKPLTDCDIVNV